MKDKIWEIFKRFIRNWEIAAARKEKIPEEWIKENLPEIQN